MNGQDIQIEQNKAYESMEKSNKKAHKKDLEMAEYVRQYDIALGQKILQLRTEGVQASIVEKVAKSDPQIADIKFNASVCEAESRAAKENINIKKKIFDSLEATKKRELG